MRVTANRVYRFDPVLWDQINPPYGVQTGILKAGDSVRVVNLPGCPRANTKGHCHIESVDGEQFLGLVCVNSLEKYGSIR
jgi:hypothetical protein